MGHGPMIRHLQYPDLYVCTMRTQVCIFYRAAKWTPVHHPPRTNKHTSLTWFAREQSPGVVVTPAAEALYSVRTSNGILRVIEFDIIIVFDSI